MLCHQFLCTDKHKFSNTAFKNTHSPISRIYLRPQTDKTKIKQFSDLKDYG